MNHCFISWLIWKNLKGLKHQLYQVQQPDQLMLPAWVKVTEVRFNEINGKENQLRTSIGEKSRWIVQTSY